MASLKHTDTNVPISSRLDVIVVADVGAVWLEDMDTRSSNSVPYPDVYDRSGSDKGDDLGALVVVLEGCGLNLWLEIGVPAASFRQGTSMRT